MQRYMLIVLAAGGCLALLAGCPKQSADQTDTATAVGAAAQDGSDAETVAAAEDGDADHVTVGSGDTAQVVRNLFAQRSRIDAELETLAASPGAAPDEVKALEGDRANVDRQLQELAATDPDTVKAELSKLADDNPMLAADWQKMVANPTAAPSIPEGIDDLPLAMQAGDGIALSGPAYHGAVRPIEELRDQLKEVWEVQFTTSFGQFTMEVYPELAPLHAVRFLELVEAGYYDDLHIHRIVPGWVVQWGELADLSNQELLRPGQEPPLYPQYRERAKLIKTIRDEPAMFPTSRWTVCFAKDEDRPNSATTQPFINLDDNTDLGRQGFTPFGYITEGRDHILQLVASFEPVMAAARERLRDEMRRAGKEPTEIQQRLQDESAWAPYVEGWDPFRDAFIKEARIVKRP